MLEMLSRTILRSLRAPASRAQYTPLRALPSIQSRTYAKVGKPSTPEFKKDDSKATSAAPKSDPEYNTEQPEFASKAAPEENAPQNDAAESEPKPPFKLPDMRGGLPSTLEFETTGKTASESAASTLKSLNITEDPAQDPEAAEGKRPKGELPASAYVTSGEKKRARTANIMYGLTFLGAVGAYVYLGRNWESEEEEAQHKDAPSGWSVGAMWKRFRARTGDQLSYYQEPAFTKLLPDVDPSFERPYTLCLSLEDLLIHNEWTREHGYRIAKRPGLDYFLRYLSYYYELVIFTTVPWAVGDPVVRKLDPYHIVTWPLYREATKYKDGEYVKVRNKKDYAGPITPC